MLLEILFGIVLFAVIWWVYTTCEDNPLSKIPGPPRKFFFGNALELVNSDPNDVFHIFLNFTNQFGERCVFKVFRSWIIHITNPADIEATLSHSKNITKSLPYSFLRPWLGSGLLLSTGSKWHKRRKILTPAFHFNILKSFFVIMEEKSRNLIATLRETKGQDVNLLPLISNFTLYAICETAMGTQLDNDQSSATVEYKNAIVNIGHLLLSRITMVWLHYDFIFKRTKFGRYFENSLNIVDTFAKNVIMERRKHHTAQEDNAEMETEKRSNEKLALLDLLLEAERKGEIDLEGIREEVNTFMFEGHDTTAMALTYCLMLLADHEDIQEHVYEECESIFKRCDGKPSMADFSEMKYLEAVIKETLRLYPSVPFIGRNIDHDFMMRDLLIKKGTEVTIHIYSLHHREDLYSEPDQFRPERFLERELKHPYAYLPFSAGPRNCIGQRFAMLEMKSVLYEIFRNFTLEPKEKGWRPTLISDMVLRPLDPIHIKFIPRN